MILLVSPVVQCQGSASHLNMQCWTLAAAKDALICTYTHPTTNHITSSQAICPLDVMTTCLPARNEFFIATLGSLGLLPPIPDAEHDCHPPVALHYVYEYGAVPSLITNLILSPPTFQFLLVSGTPSCSL